MDLPIVFGKLDENIISIEGALGVSIVNRDGQLMISGQNIDKARQILQKLADMAEAGEEISASTVNYLIASVDDGTLKQVCAASGCTVCITCAGKPIKPKTLGQERYVEMIDKNIVIFGVGPAGTGKTYLAMAAAIAAFKRGDVSRIILTRPAIEAGETLGFLPGDLQQKVDPYLRPLYDALFEIMGPEAMARNMEKGLIEVAPLAYMRGRTLDNSFIVLDEAQNTTPAQMKMFLTRIGFGSKAIITGDITQIDLADGTKSGLKDVLPILKGIEGIGIAMLTNKDVVRHPLVQRIIAAYEKHEKSQKPKGRDSSSNVQNSKSNRG
ncbi:MAG: PhoH family protein [Clostridiales bacterium]|jgi:phosphate starvation-inducible PhoH-like protein|nr:PhoH family protein [Clostridiales bacterium]